MSPSKRGASIEPIEPQTRPSVGVVTVTDMDTVQEENDNDSDESSYSDVARLRERTHQMLSVPTVQEPLLSHSQPGSRRASELESKITANLNTRERTHQMLSVPTVQEPLLSHSQPGSRMASELESKITANLNTRERTHQMLSVPTVQEPLLSHSQPGSRMASELESKITANLNTRERTHQMLSVPTVQEPLLSHSQPGSRRASELESKITANLNTRRPSAIIAAFRRPSQALALCAATQKRFLSEMGPHSRASVASTTHEHPPSAAEILGHESLSKALSALYAKLLVVLGLAFPVTEVIANGVPNGYYQGFYLYLYSVSVLFVIFQYANLMRQKAVTMIVHEYGEAEKGEKGEKSDKDDKNEKNTPKKKKETISRYGSFYLRLGAIAFGIGSMVYSGLEFGEYFEKNDNCRTALSVITPALRMALTLLQMQFIFLTNKDIESGAYKLVQRFGFMHMLATNLCEWLYVLVAETKHEIHHLEHTLVAHEGHNETAIVCRRSNIMGSLLHNASPFLFPCTIEYSLICAVILYEMWKEVHCTPEDFEKKFHYTKNSKSRQNSVTPEKILQQFAGMLGVGSPYGSRAALHQFSVDCSHAHRGLFAGVLLIVLTIISLIMFFVLASNPNTINDAIFQVNICELILYTLTIIVAATALFHMRALPYKRKSQAVLGLDTSLLILAQTGMFVYCMFSLIGSHHTLGYSSGGGLTGFFSEFLSLNQTILQSLFIIDAWWRRCSTSEQRRDKPGRQLVTFLLVANMAMWAINTLEKNRAEFRPAHLQFYGPWAWTIITHVSMPLAIFYRFHSTICLFEIWKNSFKSKPIYLNVS